MGSIQQWRCFLIASCLVATATNLCCRRPCLLQISKTASQNIGVEPLAVAATALAGLGIHAVFLALNATMCWWVWAGGDISSCMHHMRLLGYRKVDSFSGIRHS